MKKSFYLSALILFMMSAHYSFAQAQKEQPTTKDLVLAEGKIKDVWKKKFRFGLSYSQYWAKFTGDNTIKPTFAKPSIGANIRFEYYPIEYVGIGLGAGYQQRGTGYINPDVTGGAFAHPWIVDKNGNRGDVDSTYLQRLRFNTLEVPVTLLLRGPKMFNGGVRLSAAAGIYYSHNVEGNNWWVEPGSGMADVTDVTNDHIINSVGYQFEFGTDINAGDASVFQVHLVYTGSPKNVYTKNQGDGRQVAYGIRFAWLF